MSVVGLTLGSAANAIRPRAAKAARVATSATILASGRLRSYQTKPAARPRARIAKAPSCQLIDHPQLVARAAGAWLRILGCAGASQSPYASQSHLQPPQQLDPALRGERPAVQDAGGLGGEVGATAEHLGDRGVGDDRPV